jgi:hypothetical protein
MKKYRREVLPAPREEVTNGHCNMGTFNGPIEHVNPLDAKRPLGFGVPRVCRTAWPPLPVTTKPSLS